MFERNLRQMSPLLSPTQLFFAKKYTQAAGRRRLEPSPPASRAAGAGEGRPRSAGHTGAKNKPGAFSHLRTSYCSSPFCLQGPPFSKCLRSSRVSSTRADGDSSIVCPVARPLTFQWQTDQGWGMGRGSERRGTSHKAKMHGRRGPESHGDWDEGAAGPRWKAGGRCAQGHARSGAGGASRCRASVGMQKASDPLRVLLSGGQASGSRCEQDRPGLRGSGEGGEKLPDSAGRVTWADRSRSSGDWKVFGLCSVDGMASPETEKLVTQVGGSGVSFR